MIPEKSIEQKKKEDEENVLDRRNITPAMKNAIKIEIDSINDNSTKEALANIYHILTGEQISQI